MFNKEVQLTIIIVSIITLIVVFTPNVQQVKFQLQWRGVEGGMTITKSVK